MDLDMGKWAGFIWTCYGVSVLGIAAMVVMSLRAHVRAKTRVKALEAELTKRDAKSKSI